MVRMGLSIAHFASSFSISKYRTKKPFNPLLGETYELVTKDVRFMSEQVSHHPPVSAYHQEGRGYMVDGFFESKSKLGIGTGKGKMQVKVFGV